jgi:hypothetical protein
LVTQTGLIAPIGYSSEHRGTGERIRIYRQRAAVNLPPVDEELRGRVNIEELRTGEWQTPFRCRGRGLAVGKDWLSRNGMVEFGVEISEGGYPEPTDADTIDLNSDSSTLHLSYHYY